MSTVLGQLKASCIVGIAGGIEDVAFQSLSDFVNLGAGIALGFVADNLLVRHVQTRLKSSASDGKREERHQKNK